MEGGNSMSNNEGNHKEGRYFYGILGSKKHLELGPIGIGKREDVVYTLPYQEISAIISKSPIVKYPVTREYTTEHTKVLDKAAEEGAVLPVRFCTIGEYEDEIVEKVLKPRYDEFVDLLQKINGKVELRVRARWVNMDDIFAEVVAENRDIKSLKESLLTEKNMQVKRAGMMKVGEMIQTALEEKKTKEANELLETLTPLSVDYRENTVYGDINIVNAAFLVPEDKEAAFDEKVSHMQDTYGERKLLKYTRSVVAYNFVEIVIHW
jgi:hypothetical protein